MLVLHEKRNILLIQVKPSHRHYYMQAVIQLFLKTPLAQNDHYIKPSQLLICSSNQ